MSVPKPSETPRWADGGTNTATNVVDPPEHNGSILAWVAGPYTVATFAGKGGNYYIVTSISGTGTSTTGPTGTSGNTIDNPGANQVIWTWVTASPVTKDSGWLPNQQPPAQWFNWLFFTIYQWILWLADINEFNFTGSGTNPLGAWTGRHNFNAPVQFLGGTAGSGALPPLLTLALAGTNQQGGNFTGDGSGDGAEFNGGSAPTTGGNGVTAFGGASGAGGAFYGGAIPSGGGSGGYGVNAIGGPAMAGIQCSGGSGGAVGATCLGTGTASGCVGVATTGPGGAGAVSGLNLGSGPGILGLSTTGPGGQFQSSSGGSAILCESAYGTPCGFFQNTAGGYGINVITNGGTAGFFENSVSGGKAIDATSNSTAVATVTVENTSSTGNALEAVTSGTGTALKGTSTNSVGINGVGGSSGSGVAGEGGSSDGNGVSGIGGGSAGNGVEGFGTTTGAGVVGANFAGGPGIEAANAFILLHGNGGFIAYRIAAGPTGNATIDPSILDTWTIPALTGNVTWTLDAPASNETTRFKIRQPFFPPGQLHTLTIAFGVTVAVFAPGPGGGSRPATVEWEFDPANGWLVIGKYDPDGNVSVA